MTNNNEEAIPLNLISSNIQQDYQIEKYSNWDLSIETISRLSSQKTIRLPNHYASKEVVELGLTNNAIKSLEKFPFQSKSYNESERKQIKSLLSDPKNFLYPEREISENDYIEWSSTSDNIMRKSKEFREQINIYKTYDNQHPSITKLLVEIIQYYINEYLVQQENFSKDYIEKLERCFQDAIKEQNYFVYFIKAYTMTGNFYRVLNRHLALYILDYFDISSYASPPGRYRLINCLVHIVTLLINNPDVDKYRYTGITYRGLLMKEKDLKHYQIDNYILNRSFVSTSKNSGVAEMFAGIGHENISVDTSSDEDSREISVLFKYTIKRNQTGVSIGQISSISGEEEVLILPFSVFKITNRIENCPNMNSPILYEIDLEEYEEEKREENATNSDQYQKKHPNLLDKSLTSRSRQKEKRRNRLKWLCISTGVCTIFGLILAVSLSTKTIVKSDNESQDDEQKKTTHTNQPSTLQLQQSPSKQVERNQTTEQLLEKATQSNIKKATIVQKEEITTNSISTVESTKKPVSSRHPQVEPNTRWNQNGLSVIKSRVDNNGKPSLGPYGFEIDDDQTIIIADYSNHRVWEWKSGATSGEVLAGRSGRGSQNDQLNFPTDVIIDKEADRLIICDRENRRVVRWHRRGGESGETIISHVKCFGITMDIDRFLYVSDLENHEVRRWRIGESQATLVAGGNGHGNRLDQLHTPHYIFIDHDLTLFVSDSQNHRVMKWMKDASEGIVVAGGQGKGNASTQLSWSEGIFVDQSESIYVADCSNNRIMRWLKGGTHGTVVLGENGYGNGANQLNCPMDLTFDLDGNLYVADYYNYRVQKFDVNKG